MAALESIGWTALPDVCMTMEPATDLISEALQQVRLGGAVLFCVDLGAPWCVLNLPPPASHVTLFHVVLEGECWAGLGDSRPQRLEAGDAVILPRADVHWLGDRSDGVPVPAAELYGDTPLSQLRLLRWGGDGAHTRILCGFLGYERAAFSPLYDALPPLFQVRLGAGGAGPPLDAMLRYAEDEVMARRPGSSGMRLRMTELLFVESLRRYMANLPPDEAGWLAAVRDPLVGRAMALLHAAPQRPWNVELLAREAATSRSSLAERFKQVLGEPPMQYLTRWRMLLAARRLCESRGSIAAIAEAMGYDSPAAFQRAFKRQMGATPAQWRRHGEPNLP
jgi:AraC-like DNA-binding protein